MTGTTNKTLATDDLTHLPEAVAGDYVECSVADTGTGMSAETQIHAFDPIFTAKPVGEGSRLSCSRVYGFARETGG